MTTNKMTRTEMTAGMLKNYQTLDLETLACVEGGRGMTFSCLGAAASSFAAGASAVGAAATGAGLPVALYLGAQALATGATVSACMF